MKKFKLFLQETGYTCTCAVAKMLLESKGIEMSEIDIEKDMKVDPMKGASVFQLMEFLKFHGIKTELFTDSSFEELKKGDETKLLLFSLWGKIEHVAIIEEIFEKGLMLLDPATGRTFLKFSELEKQWIADGISNGFVKVKF